MENWRGNFVKRNNHLKYIIKCMVYQDTHTHTHPYLYLYFTMDDNDIDRAAAAAPQAINRVFVISMMCECALQKLGELPQYFVSSDGFVSINKYVWKLEWVSLWDT